MESEQRAQKAESQSSSQNAIFNIPSLSLPKGGGAIHGIGEKFAANPLNGTGSMTIPIPASAARSGFNPQLTLAYDSGSGNGIFGFGWSLAIPSITRRTDRGLPRYQDDEESDIFILSGSEDLVPELRREGEDWIRECKERMVDGIRYEVRSYRPRMEGLFARIERWTNLKTGETHWRSISGNNVTTLYGQTAESRIADPAAPRHVFTWLMNASYDDRGNAMIFEYRAEDSEGIEDNHAHERNRTPQGRSANRYLKRVRYGNRVSRLIQPDLSKADWMFEIVFDYGEHDAKNPKPKDAGNWYCRKDPFSSYRSAFEVRTYRLCQRILIFHHFPEEEGVGQDCLVRTLNVHYRENMIASFLTSVEQVGFRRDAVNGYIQRSLPPIEFEYSLPVIDETVHSIDAASLENLPYGLDGRNYQWIDLDGEGLPGILVEQRGAWFYRHSQGNGRFGPLTVVATQPSLANLRGENQQLIDLAGDGQLDLVLLSGYTPGFYERNEDNQWENFQTFTSLPDLAWNDPNLRFVDLDSDGHADILITQDDVLTWYPSLAEEGFGEAQRVFKSLDEEEGPRLVFADREQCVYLADLSGDGLTDLVRIRNGEVCYWPNLGYARFGARITMDASPWFDLPDQFDQRRVRLADIDGSGATDLIYLSSEGVFLYFNQSGNRWSKPHCLEQFPRVDNLSSVQALDLLGTGTACLVWSSPLPGDAAQPIYYIDLMNSQKPHLLVNVRNNLGAETHVKYVSSTYFYLQDENAGTPWVTRLPFPVHVIEQVETYDRISRNRSISHYSYHHGYFDGIEREFRGFGRVDQVDTEEFAALTAGGFFPTGSNVDAASHVPPVLTKTWFHTGAYLQGGQISRHFRGEYWQEPGIFEDGTELDRAERRAMLLEDTLLPPLADVPEMREAVRSLKGSILRQEIYALDHSEAEQRPYSVSERNYTIQRVQPFGANRHAVFFTHAREVVDYHYERKLYPSADGRLTLPDPRISHTLTLAVDDFGNVLETAAIGYGRRRADPDPLLTDDDREKQQRTLFTFTVNRFTNAILEGDDYHTPLPCESRTYELLDAAKTHPHARVTQLIHLDEMIHILCQAGDGSHDLPFEDVEGSRAVEDYPYRRLITHTRSVFRRDDLAGALPLGQMEIHALPDRNYQLAFTPQMITAIYGARVTDKMLTEGGYTQLDGHTGWWMPTGQIFYSPNKQDTPAQELAIARSDFFLARRFRDLFGQDTIVEYDRYRLLMLETRDGLGNRVSAGERDGEGHIVTYGLDYRVLQPRLVMDANRNRAMVAFDTLGMVAGTAVLGKPEENLGDRLDDFRADLPEDVIAAHLRHPLRNPHAILHHASGRLIYDLFAYQRTQDDPQPQPPVVYFLTRETHVSDLAESETTHYQHSFSYSDGFGRVHQKKAQAEPGALEEGGEDVSPRWVGSGWTIFNNKGKPVRQYESFFSSTHQYEFARVEGVSPTLFYDPVGRQVASLMPNHTYEKAIFDPWKQISWDVNDTVIETDPAHDPDVGDFFRRLPPDEYLPTWYTQRKGGELGEQEQEAAEKAARHANTPAVAYMDTLGRNFIAVAHNRTEREGAVLDDKFVTRTILDIQGNPLRVIDPQGRQVTRSEYSLLGSPLHTLSMEAGERWQLSDATGKPFYGWDSRGHRFHTVYDVLQRPIKSILLNSDGAEQWVGRTIYGETQPDPEAHNLRGQVFQVFDQAGILTNDEFDYKGNLRRSQRKLAREYQKTLDWAEDVPLEAEIFTSQTRYDALNRPVEMTAPDGSRIRPSYNEANLLERVEANLRGETSVTAFVSNINYDAKGQRRLIEYGNGVQTTYQYDPLTFRLVHLLTRRNLTTFPQDCHPHAPHSCHLQNLIYTYDPVGNITHIRNDAQQAIFFRNRRVDPGADYTYDAVYRLIRATGREHLGQNAAGDALSALPASHNDLPRTGLLHPNDGNAMGRYLECYDYDASGNFLKMIHHGADPAHPGWTRTYDYQEQSPLQPEQKSNRLTSTILGSDTVYYSQNGDGYDLHGNMLHMPHLHAMEWDYRDQLSLTQRQAVNEEDRDGIHHQGERTFYVYDSTGKRVRKVTERHAPANEMATRKSERIYLSGFEIYREYDVNNQTVVLERQTLHILDDQKLIALVETRTQGDDGSVPRLIRFQIGDHLGSASIELDDQAQIITSEEFYPYGSTSYHAIRSGLEKNPKRYRYTGMERDDESGLEYHKARYYAPWIGRWTSCDPSGLIDGPNLYRYARGNPVSLKDPSGRQPPDPANFGSFQAFQDASPKVYTNEYLLGEWEAVNGPVTPAAPRAVTYSVARSEANVGAAAFRAQEGMNGPVVQAGHTIAARHTPESGISRAAANAPETFMPLTSRHGYGMSVDVSGHPNPLTPHNAQELVINQCVDNARAGNGGVLTPEAHQAAGAEVRWRLQGTGFDQREVDIKRASGVFDEAAAIENSPAVQAYRSGNSSPFAPSAEPSSLVCKVGEAPEASLASAETNIVADVAAPEAALTSAEGSLMSEMSGEGSMLASETSMLGKVGGGALIGLNICFAGYGAYSDYKQGDNVGVVLNLSTVGPQAIVTGPLAAEWESMKAGGQLLKNSVDCSELGMGYEMGDVSVDDKRLWYCMPYLAPQIQNDINNEYFQGF